MALSVLSDARTYKIKNIIVLPFIIAGLIINLISDGLYGVLNSFLGALIPFAMLILLYSLHMLGAGDIKLFSAIGSIMGTSFILQTLAFSFLSGGILSIIIICINKNAKQRLSHLYNYIKTSLLTLSLSPYSDYDKSSGSVFHFSYAAACGAIISCIRTFYGQGSDFFRF